MPCKCYTTFNIMNLNSMLAWLVAWLPKATENSVEIQQNATLNFSFCKTIKAHEIKGLRGSY